MKKLLSVALIATMLLSFFAFTTYAEENYDVTLTLETDKETYNPGDVLTLSIVADKGFETSNGTLNITYNTELLTYKGNKQSEIAVLPYIVTDNAVNGEYRATWALQSNVALEESKTLFLSLQFTVNSEISNSEELNFRWIFKKNNDFYTRFYVKSASSSLDELNIKYIDTASAIVTATNNTALPTAKAFATANVFEDGKVDINGTEKSISTAYAAAFGTVVARNGAKRVRAGFLLSTSSTGLTIDNKDIKNLEAVNFSSENIFGGLFYGPGLEAGKTYYVMPYVTYSDDITLYAPSAVSFTMPN